MFFNIGGGEILVIAMVALIAVGPEQLPGLLRKIGRFLSQARAVTGNLRDEFMSGLDDVKDLADTDSWMGSGADDDPVVPRGFANQQRSTDPVQKPSKDAVVTSDEANTDSDTATETGTADNGDEPVPVVNEIAAANAMRAPDVPPSDEATEVDEPDAAVGADVAPADEPALTDDASETGEGGNRGEGSTSGEGGATGEGSATAGGSA
jgi:sec-independent protein translocase protein TatB